MMHTEREEAPAALRFAVCLRNDGWPVCLQVRKVYHVLPPQRNDPEDWLRVVDETEEDYLFPAEYFHVLDLPREIGQAMLEAQPDERRDR